MEVSWEISNSKWKNPGLRKGLAVQQGSRQGWIGTAIVEKIPLGRVFAGGAGDKIGYGR